MGENQAKTTEQRRFLIEFEGCWAERVINRGRGTKDPDQADPHVGDRLVCIEHCIDHTIATVERIY